MMRWQYHCYSCSITVWSGTPLVSCQHCGNKLILVYASRAEFPIKQDEIDAAMEDIMAGVEKLLGENESD